MHKKNIITAGKQLNADSKVLIMLHGRGASAKDILSLATFLNVKDFTLFAPQATNNTWYPYSFLAPPSQNEPWLSSALNLVSEVLSDLYNKGIPSEKIYFTGFSQGACLMLEFITRNANKYGGISAFTGGLIGDKIYRENYMGDFHNTPIFMGTSNPDPHVPIERFYTTSNILKEMNAVVSEKVYSNLGHTINQNEIGIANKFVFDVQIAKP